METQPSGGAGAAEMPGRKRRQPSRPASALSRPADRGPGLGGQAGGPRSVLVSAPLLAPFSAASMHRISLSLRLTLWQTARPPEGRSCTPTAQRPLLHGRHVSARGQPGQRPGLAVLGPSWRPGRAVSKGQVTRSLGTGRGVRRWEPRARRRHGTKTRPSLNSCPVGLYAHTRGVST